MPTLRLLADDLTGALDSAGRLVPLVGPVPIMLRDAPPPPTAAIDSATRECDAPSATTTVSRLAPYLRGADIAFKKIDSLLRGNIAAELAACMPHFDHCVLARPSLSRAAPPVMAANSCTAGTLASICRRNCAPRHPVTRC